MCSLKRILPFISLSIATLQTTPLRDVSLNYQPRPYNVSIDLFVIESPRKKASIFRSTVNTSALAWFDSLLATDTKLITSINTNFSNFYITVPPPNRPYNDSRPDVIPILLLHGWPSTALKWVSTIPSLVSPDNNSEPAFHIIAPDIPDFGFSSVLNNFRVGLGYKRYAVYSTDLGTTIAMGLVVNPAESVMQYVTDFYITFPGPSD
ncbi:hypothetical protein GGP41_005956 [Bipolaris sorokiniana]|uniref:Epoxide hydrolase N-terminal domain-containing protein n=2 Tax=Cochliobolus sativus TaxID=45130 RepID=A0A8H5ZDS8_COCSA|nr:uncharacterized protein COCSADRAFT_26733 [Bipolaris sorokiniana ND90Pr]EMD63373.1 hypothetical protein COCSADRAFT_26733 [Bipolaris sorokiniana ND90Pr]KAF5848498.1 hypothetical protein GGP41_005956 [Bipolaris sorokiniana]